MLRIYSSIMGASSFFLRSLLKKRCKQGKEDPARLGERMGIAGVERPEGQLVWFHAASVGEAQSALTLIDALQKRLDGLHILVTTGTVSSADLMKQRLPKRAIHQYYPLDHPAWVESFLKHWKPDMAVWLESELWPNMLKVLKRRHIPCAIVNARLSPQSFKRWKLASGEIGDLLKVFAVCLTQTEDDASYFTQLGAPHVIATGNMKYSAAPLPYNKDDFDSLRESIKGRPVWLYASTHDAEEEMACRLHNHIKKKLPDLLTIIAPRHPQRRDDIKKACGKYGVKLSLRGDGNKLPARDDDIYIADTMGELGLFYRLVPLACIGRTFSSDGGGGHNPIEAAQLDCAILHGPYIQNLAEIFNEFDKAGAALLLKSEQDFQNRLERLLVDSDGLDALQNKAHRFAQDKAKVLDKIMKELDPLLDKLDKAQASQKCA